MVRACTIIARNYMAHARVLAQSFFEQHPNGTFTVLLIDDENRRFDERCEQFRCLRLSDIELNPGEIGRLAAVYDVTELATAVKPPFLRYLLREGPTDVVYLDPDIRLYGSLDEVSELAQRHSIVLTPHTVEPVPRDERKIDEFQILAAGMYNLGFIAVGPGSETFIDWWWQKTRREARSDPLRMMFTDQRWVDFVPSFFAHFILKDPAYNVAYWNLHARELTWTGDTYLINGQPLKFFHFSGFDSRKPHLLSKHQGDSPRILLSERPALARICRDYVAALERAGADRESALPYGWSTLASGIVFDRRMRRLYRERLEEYEKGGGREPPCPFDAGAEERFMEWLDEPVAVGLRSSASRYLYSIYQDRPDLQRVFPDLAGADWPRYLEWIQQDGIRQEKIPAALVRPRPLPEDQRRPYVPPSDLTEGVNIAGYFSAEVGVGEAARLLTTAIEAGDIPHSTLTYDATLSRKAHEFLERGDRKAPHDINIVCVNADQTPTFAKEAGRGFYQGRHTAGYWFWELEHFPATMHAAFDFVDEVWTASRFVASGIRAIGRRPVFTIPLPIPVPRCSPNVTRSSLGLPAGFMFLFMFDLFSVLERKNPIGLIAAFERAFRPGEGPFLVIKTINGDLRLNDLERVRARAAGRPDIIIVDEYYSAEQKNALLGLCDCYVSLHRSEGLGLTMAEAMGLGKPVIATGYSGNLDFMTPSNSFLVDYVKSAVPAGCGPYPEGSQWAEPDIDQAAEYMRRVYEAREEAAGKARQAREDILTKHTIGATAGALNQRLDDIRRARAGVSASAFGEGTASGDAAANQLRTVQTMALDRIVQLLTPIPSVARGARFAGLRLKTQGLLLRILRPYWWQQRQIQSLLVDALRDANSASQLGQGLERLWDAVHSLEHMNEALQRPLREATARSTDLQAVQQSVATFQTEVAAHLATLTDQLATVTGQTTTLSQRLYAVPFMDEPDRFHHLDERGRRVLGFRSKRDAQGDVYVGFEDVFRGSERLIRDRFRVYVPLLRGHEPIVDIGCGRGELLDLLREDGVPAFGVDIDEAMVRRCRVKGHNVEHLDGTTYLRQQPDSSLSTIFSAQVVEHLGYHEWLAFLELSRAKLKPGGRLIFETVNPHALEAFKTFWTDLTHQRPIFPEVALAWCWLQGFDRAYVLFPNGTGDLDQDRPTQGEYAVVATKGGPG